jgi:choline dehydrogenase-like flavoprotein
LANRLSADASKRVLLIEAGKRDDYHWIHIPVGYLYCIGNPRTDWLYQTEAADGLNGRSLRYPRGKVLGGCSSINGMIYMRGQARDYDQWAQLMAMTIGAGISACLISKRTKTITKAPLNFMAPKASSQHCLMLRQRHIRRRSTISRSFKLGKLAANGALKSSA